MTTPIGTFAGIGSGFDYRSLVDAIIAADSQPATALQTGIDTANAKIQAYGTYSGLLNTLETAVKALRDGTAFDSAVATVANATAANGATVLGASAAAGAAPGSYAVQVLQTARAEKLSGASVAAGTAALGYAGDFFLNGKTISVASTDSLAMIRDKINAANSGSSPTGVTASVVADSSTSQRLVLTAQQTGAAGIDLRDGAQGVAQQLGWIDNTESIKHPTSAGALSDNFASSTATVGSMLGLVTAPGPQTITVGGKTVSVDLGADSLSSIAAKLSGLSGISASVHSTVVNGATRYYLDVENTTSFVDAGNTLAQLGVLKAGNAATVQQLQGGALTAGNATTPATASTLLTSIWNGGSAGGAVAGDTLSISGTRGDGAAVTTTFTISSTSTVQDLLNALNDPTTGFGGGTRPASASVDAGGHIVLTDGTAGQSSLGMQIVANNQGGGRLDLGAFTATTVGRSRQLVAGADAKFTVDGVAYTRSSNTVTDVIANATLNLTAADPSVTATVTIDRSVADAQKSVQGYVDAYNKLVDFISQQQTAGTNGATNPTLYNDPLLRLARSSLATQMLSTIQGTAPDMSTAGMAGISLTKDGHLSLDSTKFQTAYTTRYDDVQKLFTEQGTATNPNVVFGAATGATQPGTYAINITQAATQASKLGSGFSGTYVDDATPDVMTVTDTGSGASVQVQLANGMTTDQIVASLNSAFGTAEARALQTSAVLNDASGTAPATSSTLMTDLHQSNGTTAGVAVGDGIAYSGVRPDGTNYSGTFTVGATSTVADFVTQLQNSIGGGATVSFTNGQIAVRSTTTGASPLSLTLTPNNAGGGTLSFGAVNVTAQGHAVVPITASNVGGQLQLTHGSYGAAAGFSVAFTGGGTNNTAQLGLTAGTVAGTDVAGTIGGYAATGSGRTLVGAAGTPVDGLSLSYLGTTVGAQGSFTLNEGVGALVDRLVSSWTDPAGSVASTTQQLNQRIADNQQRLTDFNARMAQRKAALLKEYLAMDTAVQQLQSQGSAFLSAFAGSSTTSSSSGGAPVFG